MSLRGGGGGGGGGGVEDGGEGEDGAEGGMVSSHKVKRWSPVKLFNRLK